MWHHICATQFGSNYTAALSAHFIEKVVVLIQTYKALPFLSFDHFQSPPVLDSGQITWSRIFYLVFLFRSSINKCLRLLICMTFLDWLFTKCVLYAWLLWRRLGARRFSNRGVSLTAAWLTMVLPWRRTPEKWLRAWGKWWQGACDQNRARIPLAQARPIPAGEEEKKRG